jgi:hypothetical protein
VTQSAVLVVARDLMGAALIGTLIELAGHRPVFPRPGEAPLEAITRLRPALVLLDCAHDLACEEEGYERARSVGARVLLFTPSRTAGEIAAFARKRGVEWVRISEPLAALSGALERAIG